jgi:hypothetical protein
MILVEDHPLGSRIIPDRRSVGKNFGKLYASWLSLLFIPFDARSNSRSFRSRCRCTRCALDTSFQKESKAQPTRFQYNWPEQTP